MQIYIKNQLIFFETCLKLIKNLNLKFMVDNKGIFVYNRL